MRLLTFRVPDRVVVLEICAPTKEGDGEGHLSESKEVSGDRVGTSRIFGCFYTVQIKYKSSGTHEKNF